MITEKLASVSVQTAWTLERSDRALRIPCLWLIRRCQ